MLSVANKPIILSVIMLSVVIRVVKLSVVLLNDVAPLFELVTAGSNEEWHFV
jgi:hypothetical protein